MLKWQVFWNEEFDNEPEMKLRFWCAGVYAGFALCCSLVNCRASGYRSTRRLLPCVFVHGPQTKLLEKMFTVSPRRFYTADSAPQRPVVNPGIELVERPFKACLRSLALFYVFLWFVDMFLGNMLLFVVLVTLQKLGV